MPIEVATEIQMLGQEEFHALDKNLMGVVFDVHNQFGRFLDEALYKVEIAARWLAAGFDSVEREVRVSATHESFRKDYSMDLLFNHGLLLEAKVAERLVAKHDAQTLNYMFLCGMNHARLVNLRPEKVEYKILSTGLTREARQRFTVADDGWRSVNHESARLREYVLALLQDWGAFLEITLYREAVIHFLGGPSQVIRPVEVQSRGKMIGAQSVHLLTADTAFAFTASVSNQEAMRDHQMRILQHTPLRFIQWVNFHHDRIEFTTLSK